MLNLKVLLLIELKKVKNFFKNKVKTLKKLKLQ